ncbi:23S rRNA pseudouridine(955/2504/2580) synthase RluC [Candidatus Pantoea edessiphila]|uniref:Pseudouridine synthase n=1 Tax=Candidatus Pantoea edessiphila TaxID=2044610 RepID=A0A2P5SZ78_9GAMM|nr:23S rRNA pseudouridine(955/2504/2580) synthase RluC [Candidatus Pantoea edessiphila]MBK4775347.1 23S rRNA pseudouridine(955/2504/2580) synthase RluC [Pantoea sp. Edef]PPI87610.1 23S rRNA pseudouridine(955/2504/2580) synthase RluC [Candidatus Pantoea edessiphila]
MKYSNLHNIIVSNENINQRIDNFLHSKFKNIPKSFIYKNLRKGNIKVNKKSIKPLYKLKLCDEISIPHNYLYNEHKEKLTTKIENVSFLNNIILHEDDSIIVLNKPSGIAVHGGSGLRFGIIEGLRILRSNYSFLELVHRLDRSTSGLLLIAKKRSALRCLHEQLRNKLIKKDYLALVYGIWPENLRIINAPLKKKIALYGGTSMVCVDRSGKPSETRFQVKEYFRYTSLIKAYPITGHTHQIRVHTLHAGHPILFDKRYGNHKFDNRIINTGLNRLFLHAHALTFLHPKTGKTIYLEAPIDKILIDCLSKLRVQ